MRWCGPANERRFPAVRALPVGRPDPAHCPRILDAFNHATGPLRAKDVREALSHELPPKNIEGTRAKPKRRVELGILTEADTGRPKGVVLRHANTDAYLDHAVERTGAGPESRLSQTFDLTSTHRSSTCSWPGAPGRPSSYPPGTS
ncbi:hypothetical protein ACFVZC_35380 [Streptomyces marokkonensis]|uniref:Uncharacterized protein n=1 Tax=Streptomyces marokkonensis TaxID=324855 RepID=A0ABW6QHB1_9ACTN